MDEPRRARQVIPPTLMTMLIWVGFFGLLAAMHAASDIIGPLFLAINLVIAAWPVRNALIRHKWSPAWASVMLGVVVCLVLAIALFALGWAISALVIEMPQYQDQFTQLYNQMVAFAGTFGITTDQIVSQMKTISPSSMAGVASSALSSLSSGAAMVAVIVITLFMMVMDAPTFEHRSQVLARRAPSVDVAIESFVGGVRKYWQVTTVFGLIVATLNLIAMLIIGVPMAMVWAIFSFLTNFIPNVGFFIGVIPPVLMALLDRGPWAALATAICYIGINFVIQSLIQPKFNGDAVGVTATVSFISLLLWAMVLGPLGALLAMPLTLLMKALLVDADPDSRWFNAMIASDPDTADAVLPHD